MLDSLKKRPGSLKWPPRQRFLATERGRAALAQYEAAIQTYHRGDRHERHELERVQSGWALEFQVTAEDAAILGEFAGADRLPREVVGSLEDCGISLAQVQTAIDRLYTAGLLAPSGGGGPVPPAEP